MCDSLVALGPATDTGRTIFAKNSDRPPHERQVIERHEPRRDIAPVRCTHIEVAPHASDTIAVVGSRPEWQWGFEHGVNDAGVVAGNETIYTTLDPRPFPPALIGMDLVRLALERATTAADAITVMTDLLERYGQGGTGHADADRPYWSSFLVADRGSAFVLETSGTEYAVEAVERTRAISNRTTIPGFDATHRHPRQPVERLVDPRWHATNAVLADEPVTVEKVMRHLRSHECVEDGWSVCMHVDGVEATTASLVVELGDESLTHWLLGSPCQQEFMTVPLGAAVRFGP